MVVSTPTSTSAGQGGRGLSSTSVLGVGTSAGQAGRGLSSASVLGVGEFLQVMGGL